MIGACQGDVRHAADAVGLAEHVPDLVVQRQCQFIASAGIFIIRAFPGDVSQAHDAACLTEHVLDLPV
jgi:hypothetical protein